MSPTPTETPEPTDTPVLPGLTMVISPTVGGPGTAITIKGEKWPALAPVQILLIEHNGDLRKGVKVREARIGPDGRLETRFVFPADRRWTRVSKVDVFVVTLDGKARARALFRVVPQIKPIPTRWRR